MRHHERYEIDMKNEFFTRFGIGEDVCRGLNAMGYHRPMPVQEKVLEGVLAREDLIVRSKTGSGKTAAFGIPAVEQIDIEETLPQVLVLTPTRELAVQVCEEIGEIGRYKKVRCLPVYGKQPIHIQLRQLKQRVHVVVGTPGRLGDLIRKKHLKLEALKYLIIDEADELLKRGFLEEVEAIINKTPTERCTLLFSATMPEQIEKICSVYMKEPTRIEIESKETPIDEINQSWYPAAEEWKFKILLDVLKDKDPASCMIFCNTRTKVDQVAEKLRRGGFACTSLHGKMAQKYRLRAIRDFKEGKVPYMVATDLAGRGIHVDDLELVVNYGVPVESESYVHRIGRTGRAGNQGQALSLVSPNEQKRWKEVQDFIGYQVPAADGEEISEGRGRGSKNGTKEATNRKNKQAPKAPRKDKKGNNLKNTKNNRNNKKQKDIIKLRINAGKKKKMRPGDLLGAISNISGVTGEDIGIIDIQDTCSYVEIFNNKGMRVLDVLAKTKVKGRTVTVKKVKG